MRHVKIAAFDLPDAWYQVLRKIWEEGEYFNVKYGSESTTTKKLDVALEIMHPENKPLIDDKAPCDMRYVMNYFMEYLWFGEKRPDETYTYSSRLRSPVDQITEAVNRYAEEVFDRQITLVIRVPQDIYREIEGNRHEPPCLTILDTEITRSNGDNGLSFSLVGYFRSWDAFGALPANLAGLQLFSEAFVKELNTRGRERHVDKWEMISTGPMLMFSKNCHIYQRQFQFVEELLKANKPTFRERIQIPGNP
jgi:thymidylate synthase